MSKRNKHTATVPDASPSEAQSSLSSSMSSAKAEGYTVFPTQFFAGSDLSGLEHVMNFAGLSPNHTPSTAANGMGTDHDATHQHYGTGANNNIAPILNGGFSSSGSEQPVSGCGSENLGYIAWGSNNQLPNFIALANSLLPYTAAAIKFNIDTACGIGMRPMYRYFSNAGGTTKENVIPYDSAGSMLRSRIADLQRQIFTLAKDYQPAESSQSYPSDPSDSSDSIDGDSSPSPISGTGSGDPSPSEPISIAPFSTIPNTPISPSIEEPSNCDQQPTHRHPTYFKEKADDALDDIIKSIREEIAETKKALGIWKKTQRQVKDFLCHTNTTLLNHQLFTDIITYGICFPEIQLSQNGSRDQRNSMWNPRIVGIDHRTALMCRLERHDSACVSRHVYLSNQWLNPHDRSADTESHTTGASAPSSSSHIAALPAIDPMHPKDSLDSVIRHYRSAWQKIEDAQSQPGDGVPTPPSPTPIATRPTRLIFPTAYTTAGRHYYPLPSYWSIYYDVYQFASTIIRDRAQRKQNESMFTWVIYVHADYLEKLTNQVNAQGTVEDKKRIKDNEINRIKQFLSDKRNNGQSFAACTFTGSDGKDHDAFRFEQISYANKQAAEADKTEIADVSSIILFSLECNPDLIGSTPGGSSSKGGTYQREMLQIKQAKLAPTQQLILNVYDLVRDFNQWDEHLCWHIVQRTLTTLDASHSGIIDE